MHPFQIRSFVYLISIAALAACGKSAGAPAAAASGAPASGAPATPTPTRTPATPSATPPASGPFANDPDASLRAFGAALHDLDVEAAQARIRGPQPDDPMAIDTPTPTLDRAIARLHAWASSHAAISIACGSPEVEVLDRLVLVADALLAGPLVDPGRVNLAAQLGQALRRAENSEATILAGEEIASHVAAWAKAHGVAPRIYLGEYPEQDLEQRVRAAHDRCRAGAR